MDIVPLIPVLLDDDSGMRWTPDRWDALIVLACLLAGLVSFLLVQRRHGRWPWTTRGRPW